MTRRTQGRKRLDGALFGSLLLLWTAVPAAAQSAPPPDDDVGEESDVVAVPEAAPTRAERAPTAPPPSHPGPTSAEGDRNDLAWSIPAIPWRGTLTINGSRNFPAEGEAGTTLSEVFTANGSSYVWQPWFLRLGGHLSAGLSQAREAGVRQDSRTWTVGMSGQFLPGTRTPLGANVTQTGSVTESGGSTGSVRSDAATTTFGLTQAYAPADGRFTSNFGYGYMQSRVSSEGTEGLFQRFGTVAQSVSGSLGIPIRTENPQSLGFTGALATTRSDDARTSTRTGNLNALHSLYLEDYVMTLSSDASIHVNDAATAIDASHAVISQLGTSMDWIPSDDYPLSVTGSARLFDSRTRIAGNDSGVAAATVSLSGNYPLNRNWRFGAQALSAFSQLSQPVGDDTRRQNHSLGTTASWSGDGLSFKRGDWLHTVSYGAGSALVSSYTRESAGGTTTDSAVSTSGNVGQVFARDWPVEDGKPVRVSLAESYSVSAEVGKAATHSLNHALSLAWEKSARQGLRWIFNGSASDGRTFGETTQSFQQVSGVASADMVLSAYSSFSGTGSLAFSRQQGSGNERWNGSGTGGVRYSHVRFADVSGLVYQAQYNLVVREKIVSTASGGVSGDGLELQHIASQAWSWRLGLLGWRVEHAVSKIGNTGIAQSIFFSVTRDFSGML